MIHILYKKSFALLRITVRDDHIRILTQFTKFVLVGFSNVFVTLIVYYIFVFFNEALYLVGNTFGYIAGVLNSYLWNSKWVFKGSAAGKLKSFFLMAICYLFTYFIQIVLLFTMVELLGISYIIAPIINITITTPINFLLIKYFAFNIKA